MHRDKMLAALLVGALSIAGCAPALQAPGPTAAEISQFRELSTQFWAAWDQNLSSKDAAGYFQKDPGNLYFDLTPRKFTGWAEYERVAAQALASMKGGHAVTRINDDYTVIPTGGNVVVAAYTFHVDFIAPDGQRFGMDPRETEVWRKEGGKLLLVHQHTSLPMGQQGPAPAGANR